jgi:GT2 family glycosyltransferase
VSVVVPTRNRPVHVAACAAAILSGAGFAELIIVDQSDDRSTEDAIRAIADPRLRYVSTSSRGVTSGRNVGIESSRGEIIAFTDDDCRVSADWIERVAAVFAADPAVAAVCGRVAVPDSIRAAGYAEGFEPRGREWQGRFPPLGQWGMGANFSIRRSALERVGVFDPMLGPGSPLRAGEETDFLFRVLKAGLKVVNAQEVVVEHLGIRQYGEEVTTLLEGYAIGTSAGLFKHVRLGDVAAAALYVRLVARLFAQVSTKVLRNQRPTGAGFLIAFLSGPGQSFKFRVDPKRRQFVARH